ncbi:MAG: hypothetical protein EAZ35_11140 [Sphingobacteriia bacterium]|nr:MAG: hypothetical protein EAZ35_11140 [Sphingobacteriia bacterium]
MNDWKHILREEEELNEQELLQYLQGNASDESRFNIEKTMADTNFVNDAVEGLQQFNNPAKLTAIKNQLNQELIRITLKKPARKKMRRLADQYWLIISVLGILVLCVVGYLLIHFYSK